MSPFASLFILAVVLLVAGWCCVLAIHNAPEVDPEPSAWDARDGVGEHPHCHTSGPRGGHAYRRDATGVWECRCCGDRREAS